MRAGHVNDATAAVLGGAVTWIWAAIEKWNTPVKFILSQMALDYRVLELTVLLGKGISSKGSHAGGGAGSNHKAHAKYKIGQVKFMYKGKAPWRSAQGTSLCLRS
jgi:hypothetical protein